MKEIPLTKGKVAIVDDIDFELLSKYNWFIRSAGYAGRRQCKAEDPLRRSLYMHRIIAGAKEGELVDHANGDRLDNRRSNLRICTYAQNQYNSKASKNNKTGLKGVQYNPKRSPHSPYRTSMSVGGKFLFDRVFKTAEEAKAFRDEQAKLHHGEFSRS